MSALGDHIDELFYRFIGGIILIHQSKNRFPNIFDDVEVKKNRKSLQYINLMCIEPVFGVRSNMNWRYPAVESMHHQMHQWHQIVGLPPKILVQKTAYFTPTVRSYLKPFLYQIGSHLIICSISDGLFHKQISKQNKSFRSFCIFKKRYFP